MNPVEAVQQAASVLDSIFKTGPLGTFILGSSLERWITAVVIFTVSMLLFYVVRHRLLKYLAAFAQKTETKLDDLFVSLVTATHKLFFVAAATFLAMHALELSVRVETALTRVTMLVVIVQCVAWANRTITFWVKALAQARAGDSNQSHTFYGLSFIGRMMVWIVAILLILDNFGINISALVTGLGIGGVAVALAVQNVLGDLLASLSIILDKPFVVGDSIVVEQLQGTVEHIGLKTTRVRSVSGEIIVFSNTDLLKSRIRNYRHMQERRVVFALNISTQTSADKLHQIPSLIRVITEQCSPVRFDRAHFKEITTQAFVYEVVYFVLNSDYTTYMNIQQDMNLEIVKRLEAEGIALAAPPQAVIVRESKS